MSSVLSNPRFEIRLTADVASGLFQGNLNHQPTAQTPSVGSNSGSVNHEYHAELSLTATPLDLDLTSLADSTGNTFTFTNVTHIVLEHTSGTNGITLGGATTNAFIGAMPVPALANGTISGVVAIANPLGKDVTGTAKVLRMSIASGTAAGRISLLGR
jgi:hypothetical protein